MENTPKIERIMHNNTILAIIVRSVGDKSSQFAEKMTFVTPDEFPFQIGFHNRSQGDVVPAHFHLPFAELKNFPVQEFFFVITGQIKIELFSPNTHTKVNEVTINENDMVILNTGHKFTFTENSKVIEIKQGPYRGKEKEKIHINEAE